MDFLSHIQDSTSEYISQMDRDERKKYGQFFTCKETAAFMAGLFSIQPSADRLSVLDPGSGSGILSAALIDHLQKNSSVKTVDLVCYENDPNILDLLKKNLLWIKQHASIEVNYRIKTENYIVSQIDDYNFMLGAQDHPEKFDLIIGNPPYMKIAKTAPEATAMPDVCHGAPNTYFLFAAMSLFNLKPDGEMVYIIPRSWTSGSYFYHFRKKLLSESVIEHIHLFGSRDKVFEGENVLQETMIIKLRKTNIKPEHIIISSSNSNSDFSEKTLLHVPYQCAVQGKDLYIYLTVDDSDIAVLQQLHNFPYTLPEIGLKMKTGLTVDFRNQAMLRNGPEKQTVPLFYSQHIQNGAVCFPIHRENEYILNSQNSLLQKNTNYLFVKRFTSKEEPRRLQCGIYLSKQYPQYSQISTQNKINFICGTEALSEETVMGLFVLFNSTFYDHYYRILNGSTQVNSTEVNTMPVPSLKTITDMGWALAKMKDKTEKTCDSILRSYL